jgi:hypothetical protein
MKQRPRERVITENEILNAMVQVQSSTSFLFILAVLKEEAQKERLDHSHDIYLHRKPCMVGRRGTPTSSSTNGSRAVPSLNQSMASLFS